MKKVLIITYYWPPSGGAGVQRWLKFSKYLPEFGYFPIILTVDDKTASYAQQDLTLQMEVSPDLPVYRTKTFEPYNLYRKLSNKKEIPYGGFSNQQKTTLFDKLSRFIRGNLFVPDPRKGWNRFAIRKALELIKSESISTIITTGPPHSTHLIGIRLKKIAGIRWIADFRDPWTDIYYYKELYHSGLATRYDSCLEKKVLLASDKIITVSEDVKRLLSKKAEGLAEKITVIPNGYDETDFKKIEPEKNQFFTIAYIGTVAMSYRIDRFVEAVYRLPDKVKEKIKVRFVGNVPEEILNQFVLKNLGSNIEVLGYIPHEQAVRQMKGASLLLLAIPESQNNKGIVTGKFFEYLAARRPILAIGPQEGDVDQMIRDCRAGRLFSYNDTEKMSEFILEIFERFENKKIWEETTGTDKYSRRNLTKELSEKL